MSRGIFMEDSLVLLFLAVLGQTAYVYHKLGKIEQQIKQLFGIVVTNGNSKKLRRQIDGLESS